MDQQHQGDAYRHPGKRPFPVSHSFFLRGRSSLRIVGNACLLGKQIEIFVAHKGALWIEIVSYGKTAHGSMPEQGINAIDNMYTFMNALFNKFKFKMINLKSS